jgi:cell division protein FtsL
MPESGKTRAKLSIHPILYAIFFLAIAYFSASLVSQQRLISQKQDELARIEEQIVQAEQTAKDLERERDMLLSDTSIERIAREKLGMVKPGERVFIDTNKQ